MTIKPSNTNEAIGDQPSWKDLLGEVKQAAYFQEILEFIKKERHAGKVIYPKNSDIFNALHHTPFSQVKVVILGQDPYHGPNQAHGLCFSVQPGIEAPPSLRNIFAEIHDDLGLAPPSHGCLAAWAKQGVLLLNSVLTVEAGRPQSHSQIGWERVTDQIVLTLNRYKKGLVFLLWGAYAQKKGQIIDPHRHHILKAPHPSPLSAHRGFFGCKHFSRTNELLREQGLQEIDWSL